MGMAVENEKLIVRGTFHLDEKDLRVTRKKVFSKLRQSRPTRQFFRKNQKSFVEKNFKNEFEVIRKDNFKYRWSFIENEESVKIRGTFHLNEKDLRTVMGKI